jgi:hypothetical protein
MKPEATVAVPLRVAEQVRLMLWRFLEGGSPSRVDLHAAEERDLYETFAGLIEEVKP